MKKILVFVFVFFIVMMSVFPASADTYNDFIKEYKADEALDSLPDDAKKSLNDIGLDGFDYSALENLSLSNILSEILNTAGEQSKTPLKAFTAVIAIILLYSILYSVKTTLEGSLQPVLSICVTLCISVALVIPLTGFITSAVEVIKVSANFMLSYIPLMVLAMSVSGQIASGAGYYGIMLFSGQAVTRIASDIIAPFMKIFLAISVASSVSPNINLSGIVRYISKITKWILAFSMSIFTAVLGFKQIISMGADSVSSRAVRFSLSSFVPIVGSALSEAYRTVQGSFGLLKSGVGIIAIIALIAVYLPTVLQSVFWILTLGLSKTVGEVMGLREPCFLLEAVNTVVTTIFAVILCIMSIFIISTAVVILLGGWG